MNVEYVQALYAQISNELIMEVMSRILNQISNSHEELMKQVQYLIKIMSFLLQSNQLAYNACEINIQFINYMKQLYKNNIRSFLNEKSFFEMIAEIFIKLSNIGLTYQYNKCVEHITQWVPFFVLIPFIYDDIHARIITQVRERWFYMALLMSLSLENEYQQQVYTIQIIKNICRELFLLYLEDQGFFKNEIELISIPLMKQFVQYQIVFRLYEKGDYDVMFIIFCIVYDQIIHQNMTNIARGQSNCITYKEHYFIKISSIENLLVYHKITSDENQILQIQQILNL